MPIENPASVEARRDLFAPILNAAAERFGVDAALVRAVAYVESRFNPTATGPATSKTGASARGLMQLMPATARELGAVDLFDPRQNAEAGAKYLARLLAKYSEARTALWAYNWGPGNVDRVLASGDAPPAQVERYASRVLARRELERRIDTRRPIGGTAADECPYCARKLPEKVGGQ